ncbi:MAG TPA: thioredoxin family protein [Anaerolineales bacterium]
MILFLNQYSFVLLAIGLILMAGLVLLTRKPRWNDYLAFAVLTIGLFGAWVILHPRQTPLMDDARMVREMIGAGTPVLLEYQSPYCLACTAIQPVVDSLEAELGARAHIIRINAQETAGRELAPVYKFGYTPTFILFDAEGNELWREVGGLDAARVRDSLK